MSKVKHRGVAFETGDSVLIIPSISAAQADELSDVLSADRPVGLKADDPGYGAAARMRRAGWLRVVTAAIKRNYPDMSDAQIAEAINEEDVFDAFRVASGNAPAIVPLSVIEMALAGENDAQTVARLRDIVAKGRRRIKDPEELAPAAPGQK